MSCFCPKHKRTFVALITSINTTFSKRLRTYEYNGNKRRLLYVVCFKYFRYSFFLCVFPLRLFPACYLRWVAIIYHFLNTSYVFLLLFCVYHVITILYYLFCKTMVWIEFAITNVCLPLCDFATSKPVHITQNWHIFYLNERGDLKYYVYGH